MGDKCALSACANLAQMCGITSPAHRLTAAPCSGRWRSGVGRSSGRWGGRGAGWPLPTPLRSVGRPKSVRQGAGWGFGGRLGIGPRDDLALSRWRERHRRGLAPAPRVSGVELALAAQAGVGDEPAKPAGRVGSVAGHEKAERAEVHAMRRGSQNSGVPTAQSGTDTGLASNTRCSGTTLETACFGISVAMSRPCGSSWARYR